MVEVKKGVLHASKMNNSQMPKQHAMIPMTFRHPPCCHFSSHEEKTPQTREGDQDKEFQDTASTTGF